MGKIKTILVTGGAGYVGSVLVPKLLSLGYAVNVLDLFIYGDHLNEHPFLHKYAGDIRDSKIVTDSVRGCDIVIHLACISNDPSFDLNPDLGKSVNYDCFQFLVEASINAGVKKFIYASSSSVYGVKTEPDVTEESSLEPLTDYSKYKALCEEILLRYQNDNFCPVILRPATVCGYSPRQRFDLVVNILTNQAINNKEIKVFGGDQFRPNIHIDDMVKAYVALIISPVKLIRGEIFNVGSKNLTVSEIALTIEEVLFPKKIKIILSSSDDNRSYRITSKKIQDKIEFSTEKTVCDAVIDLKNSFQNNMFINSLTNPLYFNIKRMQELGLK